MSSVINYVFASIGYSIGTRPGTFILISSLFFGICILGLTFRLDIRMDLKSGFTRKDAPSIKEISAHVNFFGNLGSPWYMAIFAVARNQSLLNPTEKYEILNFYKEITKNSFNDTETSETFSYVGNTKGTIGLCAPFCEFNAGLWKLFRYTDYFNLTYPTASIWPYKLNLGKFLFQRTVDEKGVTVASKTIAIYFTTFTNDTTKARRLNLFEQDVIEKVKQHNQNENKTVTFVLHGTYAVTKEIRRGVKMAAPYYIAGAILLIAFVTLSCIATSSAYEQMYCGKGYLIAAAIASPIIASVAAVGCLLLLGFYINMLVLISPFLTLAIGIGVDDAFLILNTWVMQRNESLKENHSPAERLQLTLEKIGTSMAVTSLTNVTGFTLGCLAPVPEIRLFCATVALSMLFDFLFQLTLFAPLLVIVANREPIEKDYKLVTAVASESLLHTAKAKMLDFTKKYSNFLVSLWAKIVVLVFLIGYLTLSIFGVLSLETNMDGRMVLPPDSQSRKGIQIMSEAVWPEFLTVNYIIRRPPDFSNVAQYRNFISMRKSKYAIGRQGDMAWFYDYMRYLAKPDIEPIDVVLDNEPLEVDEEKAKQTGLNMELFNDFINTRPFDAWKDAVRYKIDKTNRTVITEMIMMIGYKNVKSLGDKAKLLSACRNTAQQYAEYDMVPFETDAQIIDVILDAPRTTRNTMLFTVVAMGVVFFLLSFNFTTAVLATLSVASICAGVLGMLHYWNCYLDPLTMVAVIMTAGLGVDFTVHVIFHYLTNEKYDDPKKRISATFNSCGLSTLQAGLSTFLVMLPVLFCPIGIYVVIAKAIVLVVIIGLIHGLFIVPVILCVVPNCLIGRKCCVDLPSH